MLCQGTISAERGWRLAWRGVLCLYLRPHTRLHSSVGCAGLRRQAVRRRPPGERGRGHRRRGAGTRPGQQHRMVTLIGHRLHELRRRGTHLGHNNFSTFGVDGQRPVVERRFHLLPWPSPAVTPRSGPMPSGTRVRFKSIDSERRHMGIGSGASERELSTALP